MTGSEFRALRDKLGMSQVKLAAALNMSVATLARCEGEPMVKSKYVVAINALSTPTATSAAPGQDMLCQAPLDAYNALMVAATALYRLAKSSGAARPVGRPALDDEAYAARRAARAEIDEQIRARKRAVAGEAQRLDRQKYLKACREMIADKLAAYAQCPDESARQAQIRVWLGLDGTDPTIRAFYEGLADGTLTRADDPRITLPE